MKNSLAVAYAVKRKAKMAKGGLVEQDAPDQFLSDESDMTAEMHDEPETDEQELEAYSDEESSVDNNEMGDEELKQNSKSVLEKIMQRNRKVR